MRRSAWHGPAHANSSGNPLTVMLETIAIILVLMWLLGLVSSTTLGGFIHLLLILAFIAIVIRLIRGRNPLG